MFIYVVKFLKHRSYVVFYDFMRSLPNQLRAELSRVVAKRALQRKYAPIESIVRHTQYYIYVSYKERCVFACVFD